MNYEVEAGRYKTVEVPKDVQDQIIKDYLISRYHWVIGTSMFLIGILLGIVIS